MSSTKDEILEKIKENRPPTVELPDLDITVTSELSFFDSFKESIQSVGGEAFIVEESLETKIQELFPNAKKIVSTVDSYTGNIAQQEKATPQEFEDIDLAVIKGEFAVAENGAVWVQNPLNRHRGLYFIAENIILVVPKRNIVSTMAEAYELISFDNSTYGTFISGPSKTADIEQSLVIGAHGPKQGIVLFS